MLHFIIGINDDPIANFCQFHAVTVADIPIFGRLKRTHFGWTFFENANLLI